MHSSNEDARTGLIARWLYLCSTRVCCDQFHTGVMLLVCAEVMLCWSCGAMRGVLYVLCWDRMIVRCFQERDPS